MLHLTNSDTADGAGEGAGIQLSTPDRLARVFAAAECGMTAPEFVSALVAAHVRRRPQWNASV
jgi:hypothetical protein